MPIAPTFKDHTDETIAVNLAGPPDHSLSAKPREVNTEAPKKSGFNQKIDQFIESIGDQFTLNGDASSSSSLYSVADGERQVTVVGEVPQLTVETMGRSVQPIRTAGQ